MDVKADEVLRAMREDMCRIRDLLGFSGSTSPSQLLYRLEQRMGLLPGGAPLVPLLDELEGATALLDRLVQAYATNDPADAWPVQEQRRRAIDGAIREAARCRRLLDDREAQRKRIDQLGAGARDDAAGIIADAFLRSGPPTGLRLGAGREQALRTMLREAQDEILALRLAAAESA